MEDVVVIAHTGHMLVNLAYFAPVVAFLVWLVVTQIRDRRDRSDG
jgi:cytochrome c oxidase assembly factor CtaG